jgi:SAM-dependent methyltransferase
MSIDDSKLLTDRAYLTEIQYRTDANLAARQSVYAYQQPKINLVPAVLDLAGLTGTETVADIGCGNGIYLAELARRRHAGRMLGADLSPGMLAAAQIAAPAARLIVGDAAALPLADAVADVMLAPHMLYHVPDRQAAVREFRRVTRPGGALLVVLNGVDHQRELRALVQDAAADAGLLAEEAWVSPHEGGQPGHGLHLDAGAELLSREFGSVQRYDFMAELVLDSPEPVAGYVASMRSTQAMPDAAGFVAAVVQRMRFGPDGVFRITTHCGLLLCR